MSKIETHIHTAECDPNARSGGKEIVRLYKEAGYDCLVITDHYISLFYDWFADELQSISSHKEFVQRWLKGYYTAREEGEKLGVTVLPGTEVRFDGKPNDYLIYGLEEDFFFDAPLLNRLKGLDELLPLLPSSACVVQAHPFRDNMTVADPAPLFGIEVYNGGTDPFRNEMARIFAEHYGKPMLSGSDFHGIKRLAKGGILCEKTVKSPKDLSDLLRSGSYTLISETAR